MDEHFATSSDTEVLVHLFEEQGTDTCKALRGMFAFAIVDTRARMLFLARDRFGKKPLYYSRTNSGELVFASELKALRCLLYAAGSADLQINDQAIYDYLSLGYIPQPETVFRNGFVSHRLGSIAFHWRQTENVHGLCGRRQR